MYTKNFLFSIQKMPKHTSIFKLEMMMETLKKEESCLKCSPSKYQKLQRISEHFALVRRVLENKESLFTSKDHFSIELFQDLWPREETSLTDLESEENLSTEKNSQMRTST